MLFLGPMQVWKRSLDMLFKIFKQRHLLARGEGGGHAASQPGWAASQPVSRQTHLAWRWGPSSQPASRLASHPALDPPGACVVPVVVVGGNPNMII